MKFTINSDPVPYLIIEDIFTENELELITQELEFIQPKLFDPSKTGTAINSDGSPRKSNTGVFLDELYNFREFSDILSLNRKFFCEDVYAAAKKCHPSMQLFCTTAHDKTLVSYYESGDHYGAHFDRSAVTLISWFFKEPKNFSGGDLVLDEYNIKIEPKNNMAIIFLSCYMHSVTEIVMKDKTIPCSGRFSISMFCTH